MRQILLALVLPAAFSEQNMRAPDTLQRAVANGQIEFPNETAAPQVATVLRSSTHCASRCGGVLWGW